MTEEFDKDISAEEFDNNYKADDSEKKAFFDDFIAEKINIPESKATDEKGKNRGIAVFTCILVVVILVCISSFGGYYLGRFGSDLDTTADGPIIQLDDRPIENKRLNADELYENVAESVVGIIAYNATDKPCEATGVVYSEDGYIVTNDHIYTAIPSAKFKVFLHNGTEYDAYFVAGDTRSDIAVLKIKEKVQLKVPQFGNSDMVKSGEPVCAIGCPNGYSSKSTITVGIVSVPKVRMSITSKYSSNYIQTDTAINPGNSGGALVNAHGQIVGITSAKISDTSYEGVGFAIPTKTVQRITESLITNGNVKDRAKLGISFEFFNEATAEINGLPLGGLRVKEVVKESDLHGRLVEGDIIIKVEERKIINDDIILDILEEKKPGDEISLTVYRANGKSETITAVLLGDEGSSSYTIAKGKIK